jgi:nucleoside-diphosphate-sugar epimerase
MKQYLVTCGAGFIGSHIDRALLDQNAAVRVLDNFSSGKHQNSDDLVNVKNSGYLESHEGDIRDTGKVAEVVQGVDVIFHEAAFVSVPESMEKPQECFDVNITETTVLFEAARKAGVRRAVIASGSTVYGDSEVMPLTESILKTNVALCVLKANVRNAWSTLYPVI